MGKFREEQKLVLSCREGSLWCWFMGDDKLNGEAFKARKFFMLLAMEELNCGIMFDEGMFL